MRTSRARFAAIALAIAFAGLALPRIVRAEEPVAEDEVHVRRGVELRTAGMNREALAEFEEAYALHATPRTAAQIALAQQALGAWLEAERGLLEALRSPEDPWIQRFRSALDAALVTVQTHLGWLLVESNVDGAELRVDGALVATLPLREPVRALAGSATIEVSAPGYVTARRTIDVGSNGRSRESVRLEAEPRPSALLTPSLAPSPL